MKTPSIILLLASGLAVGMLSSCVAPTPSQGQASVTTATYQPGYQISSLPSGYRSEVISGNEYYYHDGAYYRPESNGYVVVEAPRTSRYYSDYDRQQNTRTQRSVTTTTSYQPGQQITALPTGYRSEVISGNDYYYHDGAYYRRESNGYVVVDAPRTSRYYSEYDQFRTSNQPTSANYQIQQRGNTQVIRRLPSGYRSITHGGNQYYQSGENYYSRQGDGYIVVNRPY